MHQLSNGRNGGEGETVPSINEWNFGKGVRLCNWEERRIVFFVQARTATHCKALQGTTRMRGEREE